MEKRLLDLCKDHEMKILNRRIIGDLVGKLTCFMWNGSSTVDYGIAQKYIVKHVFFSFSFFFKVLNLVGYVSDHCLISLGLKCLFYGDLLDASKTQILETGFKWGNQ